ncbi:MAG: dephospho-CoA kinase [Actinomycetota bacterium]|jgi:dephospho-CoA kinase|nr:dephospho-CoA kinase [Ilumatobacteraceae bacterium]MDA2961973.1 dephospho-CoA kinase [Actinomycetota bacterium]MDA2995015.1 dephospho-CoA kinase [Actinomycetota bacterium]
MLLVGLTGGIGAGKSTVSALLAELGACIVDADEIARQLQSAGSPVLAAMAERFGEGILNGDGSLNRAAVAEIVFGNDDASKAALKDLNGIVHPAMQAEILRQIKIGHDGGQHVVLDFPLLAENPRDDLDATIVIDIDPEIAVERLVNSRGMDETDARNRIANQASREKRLAIATHVIDNSEGVDSLREQVADVWSTITG